MAQLGSWVLPLYRAPLAQRAKVLTQHFGSQRKWSRLSVLIALTGRQILYIEKSGPFLGEKWLVSLFVSTVGE